MATTKKTTTQHDDELKPKIPLAASAQESMRQLFKAEDTPALREAQHIAKLTCDAAATAEYALSRAKWLRDKLNGVIARLEAAETVRDAYMAMTDVRTSLWGDLQESLVQLQTYDRVLPPPRPAPSARPHTSGCRECGETPDDVARHDYTTCGCKCHTKQS